MEVKDRLFVALNPSKAFKVYLFHKDKRITKHMVIPKEGKFFIKEHGYVINPERVFFEQKTPCSVYSVSISEPIDPLNIDQVSKLSAKDFYNAVESKIVQDIIQATGKGQENIMVLAIGLVTIVAVAVGVYYISDLISQQNEAINAIWALIRENGGNIPNIPRG